MRYYIKWFVYMCIFCSSYIVYVDNENRDAACSSIPSSLVAQIRSACRVDQHLMASTRMWMTATMNWKPPTSTVGHLVTNDMYIFVCVQKCNIYIYDLYIYIYIHMNFIYDNMSSTCYIYIYYAYVYYTYVYCACVYYTYVYYTNIHMEECPSSVWGNEHHLVYE